MDKIYLRDAIDSYNQEIAYMNEMHAWKSKLEFAIKSLDASIWEYDIVNNLLFSDCANSALVGGMNFEKYISIHHPDDREMLRAAFYDLIHQDMDRLLLDLRLREPDDSYVWIRIHGVVFQRDEQGNVIRIIGLRRTIQDQVEAHAELIESKRKLEEYAIKTSLALLAGDVVMWNYDVETEVFSSSALTSYMYHGILKDDFMKSVHCDDLPLLLEGFNKLLLGGESTPFTCQVRVDIPGKGVRWVDLTATVLSRDAQGRPRTLTGLKRDVTQEHELTAELVALRNKAEEANRLKTMFFTNMSHEIRTPLNAIVGFSNLIINLSKDESLAEYGKLIETNNHLLMQLVNDVLDLAKIEAGKLEFHMSEICVNELLEQLKQMFQMRTQEGVKVVFDMPSTGCFITSEQNRLTQVLTNFLSNAVKYTTRGTITLGYEVRDQGLYFYVRDTGKGIAPENIPLAFNRFSKFDSLVQGTGLGLPICEMIVKRLGGKIGIESRLGVGSTFWFTLPCVVSEITMQGVDL